MDLHRHYRAGQDLTHGLKQTVQSGAGLDAWTYTDITERGRTWCVDLNRQYRAGQDLMRGLKQTLQSGTGLDSWTDITERGRTWLMDLNRHYRAGQDLTRGLTQWSRRRCVDRGRVVGRGRSHAPAWTSRSPDWAGSEPTSSGPDRRTPSSHEDPRPVCDHVIITHPPLITNQDWVTVKFTSYYSYIYSSSVEIVICNKNVKIVLMFSKNIIILMLPG